MESYPNSESSTQIYPITNGYVISQNPDTRTLAVMLRDGQILPSVRVAHWGAMDALRIDQSPLPGKGTQGVLLLLNYDINSAVWMGSLPSTLADAIGSSADIFLDYQSHWSGFWKSQDSSGSTNMTWPDGTQLTIGAAFSPIRHTVSAAGQRQAIAFTQAARVSSTPSAFPLLLAHSSGTRISISAAGAVQVSGVSTVEASDGAGSFWQLDDAGNLNIKANINVTGQMTVTEGITGGASGAGVTLLGHKHDQGVDSAGDVEQETTAPVVGT